MAKHPRPKHPRPSPSEKPPSDKPLSDELQLTEDSVQLGVRLPRSLLAALDVECRNLSKQCPGVVFTRSDGLRSILTKVISDPANVEEARLERVRAEKEAAECKARAEKAHEEQLARKRLEEEIMDRKFADVERERLGRSAGARKKA